MLLGAAAGGAVDDARAAALADLGQHPVEHAQLLAARVGVVVDLEADLGPVEAGDHDPRVAHAEPLDDLGADRRGGGGGERQHGRVAELLDDAAQPQVVGAEVVAPRGDAVRLVDDEQRRAWPRPRASTTSGLASCSGARKRKRTVPSPQALERLALVAGRQRGVELGGAAGRAPRARSSRSTWSRCRAISGETTTTGPSSSWPGDLVDRRLAGAGRAARRGCRARRPPPAWPPPGRGGSSRSRAPRGRTGGCGGCGPTRSRLPALSSVGVVVGKGLGRRRRHRLSPGR